MIKKIFTPLRVTIFSLLAFSFLSSSFAASINFDPTTTTTSAGDTFSIDVFGKTLSDLYAFQFSIGFDPTVLQVIGITEGSFLPMTGTTFFIPGTFDDVAGLISFTGDSLIGPISGASGSGILASIDFKALADGVSGLMLEDVLFLDSSLNEITISSLNGSVNVVTPDGNVPEPPLGALLLVGTVALALTRRRLDKNVKLVRAGLG